MRKLLTWVLVTLGVATLVRRLRRRDAADDAAPQPLTIEPDPADELRRKLAETREDEMPVPGEPPRPEPTLDDRRAEVHDQARAAIDDMQKSDGD